MEKQRTDAAKERTEPDQSERNAAGRDRKPAQKSSHDFVSPPF